MPLSFFLPQHLAQDGSKELHIVEGASHTDLYDDGEGAIPFDKIETFCNKHLA